MFPVHLNKSKNKRPVKVSNLKCTKYSNLYNINRKESLIVNTTTYTYNDSNHIKYMFFPTKINKEKYISSREEFYLNNIKTN